MGTNICKFCGTDISSKWWKCCPKHTTEQGLDVVCSRCQEELHALPSDVSTQQADREFWTAILIALLIVGCFIATMIELGAFRGVLNQLGGLLGGG